MKTVTQSSGKRKRAKARAVVHAGTGKVFVNGKSLDLYTPVLARMKIQEALLLAGKPVEKFDVFIDVKGGGVNGQAEAARLAVGRALVQTFGDKLKSVYLEYDRNLLVADVRRNEAAKPNCHGKPRAKRQKSYR